MLRVKRIDEIENYVVQHRQVDLDKLCEVFSVSKNTIRRDIEQLCSKGTLKKVYGGVAAVEKTGLPPFHERNAKSHDAKKKLAAAAATLVDDGDIIFIDSGTTTRHMVQHLTDKRDLTILTNNLDFIVAAVPYPDLKIITLSGELNRTTLSFSGGEAARILSNYNVTKAFMSAVAVSLESGATNHIASEHQIKTAVLTRSKTKVLLVDKLKLDSVSLQTFARLEEFDVFISENPLPPEYVAYCEHHNVKTLLVK